MNKKGSSLLEIIISIVILASVISGTIGLFFACSVYVSHFQDRVVAADLAKKFLDPFQVYVDQSTWTSSSNCLGTATTKVAACTSRSIGTVDGLERNYTGNYTTYALSSSDLVGVRVNINWTE